MRFLDHTTADRPSIVVPCVLAAIAIGLGLSFGACIQDDAFISFRYAEHLSTGKGLVYNLGSRVEGFTNLSWTLLLAGVMALGGEPVIASTVMGLICVGLGVAATWRLAQVAGLGGAGAGVAALLVAVDAQLVLESVEGLETALFMVLVTMGIARALQERPTRSSGWFAVALLTRPEGVLAWAGTQLGVLVGPGVGLARRIKAAVRPSWPVLVVLVLVTVWRLAYFGDPLPNTFYAKTGGWAVPRGLAYVLAHAMSHPVLWLLVGLAMIRSTPHRTSLIIVSTLYLVYVVLVGGDFKPTGRFVAPVLPVLAVLAGSGFEGILSKMPRVRWLAWGSLAIGLACARWPQYEQAAAWAAERHANLEARRLVGDWLAENTPPDTVLAIHSAGVIPFYAGRRTIDMWGLTDRTIARTAVSSMGQGMAGHERTAPDHVFSLKPDLYLPEDKVFTLHPWQLRSEPGFPDDFERDYRSVNVGIEGRWLNLWVRRDGLMGHRLLGNEGG